MKNILIILSLFILGFGFSPCADTAVDHQWTTLDQHDHSMDTDKESEDECTPFCICQCCGLFITFYDIIQVDKEKCIFDYSYLYHYDNQYKWEYQTTIWQPPANI
ncbi:DUF6660 family protein [Membranihabitans marinus]|uniref:DUF6660 family protein n=1 Tax=Membranihabitans marinus TaxID=1227546 RepID=UPI001F239D10|nr:DUF6660 family protein [Membranihabitans marinus]